MKKILVAPSILNVNVKDAPKLVDELISLGSDMIHFDVMDGIFVPSESFSITDYEYIKENASKGIKFDVHLMVENVMENVKKYLLSDADIITFHYEAVTEEEFPIIINEIHDYNKLAGVAIKPLTDIRVLDKYLDMIDLILIMSVEPGKGGQKFSYEMVEKMKYLDSKRKENNYHYVIEVDGGINNETGKLCFESGVDILVAGTYIIKSNDKRNAIRTLKEYE